MTLTFKGRGLTVTLERGCERSLTKINFARRSGSISTKMSCRWDARVLKETLGLRRAWGKAGDVPNVWDIGDRQSMVGAQLEHRYHTNLKHL